MVQKFDYYDLLGVLVPGILLTCWIPVCYPDLGGLAGPTGFPDAFVVLALTAVAFFAGQMIQAFGSTVEPLLNWSWGGRPSDCALSEGLGRYLPASTASRIAAKLKAAIGSETDDHAAFLFAMQLSDAAGVGRASRFNSLYAYHRGLCVLMVVGAILFVSSSWWGSIQQFPRATFWVLLVLLVGLLVLTWHRAKQRGYYYVREVLLTAEKEIDRQNQGRSPTSGDKST